MHEYTFSVREAGEEREFRLNITNEAFVSHRARYQDAPGICSARLHAELSAFSNHPPETKFDITTRNWTATSNLAPQKLRKTSGAGSRHETISKTRLIQKRRGPHGPDTGFEDNYPVLPISSCGRGGRGERDGVSRAPSHRRIVARSGATATPAKASG
jgi:hypothetical protein